MAIIIQFEDRKTNRYSRKFGEAGEKEGQILLFTGVQYERDDRSSYKGVCYESDERSGPALMFIDAYADEEKSAG